MLNLSGNEAQLRAIQHGAGPMMVIAGPGSGKTYTITRRILYLIEHHKVEPSEILVITFTKAAADEMKQRFLSLCKGQIFPVMFGTFHAIFYAILKEQYHLDSNSIITKKEKKQLLANLMKSEHYGVDLQDEILEGLLGEISNIKNSLSYPSHFVSAYIEPCLFQKLFLQYEEAMTISGKVDFDDMVLKCHALFQERKDILKKWQKTFRYILIDEFQDINTAQYEIVKMLGKPDDNIFIVGDDDQSIYRFRGASPDILFRFQEEYPHTKKEMLSINYRSTEQIIRFAEKIIKQNKERYPKKIVGNNQEGKEISIESFEKKKQAYERLIELLRAEYQNGNLEHCAVIFRTGYGIRIVSKFLAEEKIPFVAKEPVKSIYNHMVFEDIKAVLLFVSGKRYRKHFLRFMNKPMRFISRDAVGENVDFTELLEFYSQRPGTQQKILLLKKQLKEMEHMPVYLCVQYFRKAMGYDEYLIGLAGNSEEKKIEFLQVADLAADTAKGFRDIKVWEKDIEAKITQYEEEQQKAKSMPSSGVHLLTMHGCKGLEYDKVYLPDCNEGIIPHAKAKKRKEIEEERRLFYVAVTRAKKELYLQYVTGTKDNPLFPSRFLAAYGSISSNSQLSKYSSKASDARSYSASSSM